MDIPVELVTLRVGLEASHQPPELPEKQPQELATPYTHEKVSGIEQAVPVYKREDLASGQLLEGPALITEKVSTSFITPGWQCTSDAYGNLLLTSSP
jgi:N-methylhydantoinase A